MKKLMTMLLILMAPPTLAYRVLMVPAEYATIQDAVNESCYPDDIIILAPGVYKGAGNKNIKINCQSDLMITSLDSCHEVIIDAEGQGRIFDITSDADNKRVLVLKNLTLRNAWVDDIYFGGAITCEDTDLVIDSCVIENNSQASANHVHGGAIGCGQMVYLSCYNSLFRNNTASGSGGAISALHCDISFCRFESNNALNGGALVIFYKLQLSNSELLGNKAGNGGGGLSCGYYCFIEKCLFDNNVAVEHMGGAISFPEAYEASIRDSQFIRNAAACGGSIFSSSVHLAEITNCLFYENESTQNKAGAFYINSYSLRLNSCVLISNNSFTGSTCFLRASYDTEISNCIIWENESENNIDIECQTNYSNFCPTHVRIDHSVIEPDSWYCDADSTFTLQEGMIFSDPLLEATGSGDYHLTAGSPCIDNGNPDTFLETDIDGNARPVGAGFDIGVSEYQTVYSPGAHLFMEDTALAPGDPFHLEVLSVSGAEDSAADLVVMLDIHGSYFFYPTWQPGLHPERLNLEYGRGVKTILDFTWPSGVEPDWGWTFWGALLKPDEMVMIGEIDRVTFDIRP